MVQWYCGDTLQDMEKMVLVLSRPKLHRSWRLEGRPINSLNSTSTYGHLVCPSRPCALSPHIAKRFSIPGRQEVSARKSSCFKGSLGGVCEEKSMSHFFLRFPAAPTAQTCPLEAFLQRGQMEVAQSFFLLPPAKCNLYISDDHLSVAHFNVKTSMIRHVPFSFGLLIYKKWGSSRPQNHGVKETIAAHGPLPGHRLT